MDSLLFFAASFEAVFSHAVQFNMNILIHADQIQFPVFLFDLNLAGKIGSCVFFKLFR